MDGGIYVVQPLTGDGRLCNALCMCCLVTTQPENCVSWMHLVGITGASAGLVKGSEPQDVAAAHLHLFAS